jgi:hypothetical protein
MAMNLASISDASAARAPRIVLLGTEKIGKTTFACGSRVENGMVAGYGLNKPVVMAVRGEEGADGIPVAKFPVARTFDEVQDGIGALFSEDHEYETVVIDSASALEPMLWDKTCSEHNVGSIEKVGGGYGKGYTEALSHWRKMLDGLDALRNVKNMASIIIGHVKVKSVNNPDTDAYDAYHMDINDKAANLLYRWADLILFANVKVAVRKEDMGFEKKKQRAVEINQGVRYLYTQKRPSHPGGGRGVYGLLPYELPLDWESFETAVAGLVR